MGPRLSVRHGTSCLMDNRKRRIIEVRIKIRLSSGNCCIVPRKVIYEHWILAKKMWIALRIWWKSSVLAMLFLWRNFIKNRNNNTIKLWRLTAVAINRERIIEVPLYLDYFSIYQIQNKSLFIKLWKYIERIDFNEKLSSNIFQSFELKM